MKGCTVNHDVCLNSFLSSKRHIVAITVQGLNATTYYILLYSFATEVIIHQQMQFFLEKTDILDIYFQDISDTHERGQWVTGNM